MATLATLGPLEFDIANVFEDDEIKRDGSEKISILCSPAQAKQIIGLCDDGAKNKYGSQRVISSKNSRWGILPVEGSIYVSTNEGIAHNGLFQLSDAEEVYITPDYSLVKITAEMLSRNYYEILSVLHSKGGEDGSGIESGYEDLEEILLHENDYTSNYTDTWETFLAYYMSPGSVSVSGGKLDFTGTKTGSPGYGGWGRLILRNLTTYTPPWTLEFDMEYTSGSNCNLSFFILPYNPDNIGFVTNSSTSNYIRIVLQYSSGTLKMGVSRCKNGSVAWLIPLTTLNVTTESNPNFRVKYYPNGEMEIYVDKTGGTSFGEPLWGKAQTGHVWDDPFFMKIFSNAVTSSATMKSGNFKISTEEEANQPNIVVAPPGAVCNLTPTFTRAGEEGNIQCFQDILDPLNYQINPADFYKGTVKAMNGKYDDSVYRLITHNDIELDPTKFYVTNGLVKLVTTVNSVEFHYWTGSAYVKLNEFTLPQNIRLIRPFMVTPWEFTLQLDRTYWTIRAGKPYIWVKHEHDAIDYILNTCYYHDETTTTDPASDADITMEDLFYCNMWNRGTGTCASPSPEDRYRLQIMKKDPTTIKSDSIPASSMTGIGWYDSTLAEDNVNGHLTLAREWFKPTQQALSLQSI